MIDCLGYPGKPSPRIVRIGSQLILRIMQRRVLFLPRFGEGRLLDVGCGAGGLLRFLVESGWQGTGVEPSADAAERARTHGLDVIASTLSESGLPIESFDVISYINVLEHLSDPARELRLALDFLKPGGELQLNVPNFACGLARHFRAHWFTLDCPRHLYHFTPDTLQVLLRAAGFERARFVFYQDAVNVLFSWIYRHRRSRGQPNAPLAGGWLGRTLSRLVAGALSLIGRGDQMYVVAYKPENDRGQNSTAPEFPDLDPPALRQLSVGPVQIRVDPGYPGPVVQVVAMSQDVAWLVTDQVLFDLALLILGQIALEHDGVSRRISHVEDQVEDRNVIVAEQVVPGANAILERSLDQLDLPRHLRRDIDAPR